MEVVFPHGQYYGQIVRSRQAAGLTLTETRYSPGMRVPRHAHEQAYFCLLRRGTYTESYGSRTRVCGPLTVSFHPSDEVHSGRFGPAEGRSFNIEVGPRWQPHLR